jgi:hypothetical protein
VHWSGYDTTTLDIEVLVECVCVFITAVPNTVCVFITAVPNTKLLVECRALEMIRVR